MRTLRWKRGRTVTASTLVAALLSGPGGALPLRAEVLEAASQTQGAADLSTALRTTRTRGAATVAVVTAQDRSDSARLWSELSHGDWARSQRGLVQFVNLTKERDANVVRTLGVTKFPTVLIYGRGPKGVTLLGTADDCTTADAVTARLRGFDLADAAPATVDPALFRASHGGDVHPSQQYPPPPTLQMPAPQPAPQPQSTLTLVPSAPTLTSSAGLIQMPSQNFVIQQGAPQIFVAPSQAPVVFVPQTMNAAPNNTLTLSATPSQPAPAGPTLTLAPSAPAATLTSGPPTAINVAPAPSAIPVTLASGPPTALASVTNQTLSLPSSATRTRVRVRGPGLFASSLARFGERLTRLGRARIETVQETTLEAPMTQSLTSGQTTISTNSIAPVASPPQTLTMSPPPQQPPQEVYAAPPPTMPSPQNAPKKHHHH